LSFQDREQSEWCFKFAEVLAAGAEHNGQLVGARGHLKLVLVAIRLLGELPPFLIWSSRALACR
jgi:hypothetical protein